MCSLPDRPLWLVRAGLLLLLLAGGPAARAVVDDAGNPVNLGHAPERIVSLSPGITELLYAIGAGDRVVGVSEFSDFPPQARSLPRVARAQGIDLERIAALRPDLIIIWGSGYSPALLAALRRLALPLYVHEPRSLESIASAIERLGELTQAQGAPAVAATFRKRLAALRQQYAGRSTMRAFYQVWASPVMTLSGKHLVSDVLRTCGARNIFEDLAPLVATVDTEAVIAAHPQIIITAEAGGKDLGALDGWRKYPDIPAVASAMLITLDADRIDRAAVRILDETQNLCETIERARHAGNVP